MFDRLQPRPILSGSMLSAVTTPSSTIIEYLKEEEEEEEEEEKKKGRGLGDYKYKSRPIHWYPKQGLVLTFLTVYFPEQPLHQNQDQQPTEGVTQCKKFVTPFSSNASPLDHLILLYAGKIQVMRLSEY